jgi:hypothetical protein
MLKIERRELFLELSEKTFESGFRELEGESNLKLDNEMRNDSRLLNDNTNRYSDPVG